MEEVEIKVEPIFDEEQNALLNIKLMENQEKTITSPYRISKANCLENGVSHAHELNVAAEEQGKNCDEIKGKTEDTLIKVKPEPPGVFQESEVVLGFSESNNIDLDSSKDEILRVGKENEFQEELHPLDSVLEGTFDLSSILHFEDGNKDGCINSELVKAKFRSLKENKSIG
ncbi:uncharacterized protein LOC143228570 [Tachypleus tridentatus]|uniref:uncharacterized protein LOC143228570 n=1 Tax=Tachypleus tridentatus TaxID=6853 RepID=UPI003FD28374